MTGPIDHGVHQIAWVGSTAVSRERIPGAGTWEIVDHGTCAGQGTLRALSGSDQAPPCPQCGAKVTWQLTHLSPTVAADHRGAEPLP